MKNKEEITEMLDSLLNQMDEMKIHCPWHNMTKYQIDPYRHGVNDCKKLVEKLIRNLEE